MGTECIGARLEQQGSDEIPSVPPGFASLTSFTLERVQDDVPVTCGGTSPSTGSKQSQMVNQCVGFDASTFKKSLRHRPWINYRQFDNSSDEESDSELFEHDAPSVKCLPKGIIRGCSDCKNCQKVIARWHSEDSCRPALDEAPVFYPSEEDFKDTLKYIASIRPIAEPFGICRIVPPPSWKPPCPLKEKDIWESSKFNTRIQCIDKLQNRHSVKEMARYRSIMRRKRQRLSKSIAEQHANKDKIFVETSEPGYYSNAEGFGFEPGPELTLQAFQKYANDFKQQYFCPSIRNSDSKLNHQDLQREWEPSVEDIEGEYWRIIEKPTEEIEVLYGADIETGDFGSGFPKVASSGSGVDSEDKYVKSGWNLNNFPRLPGSLLSFESGDISGVLVPWLYIGMCFSSFCWHVEDHHLYSLNYMHWGAPKMWYGVPGRDALKLEAAMKKHLPNLFNEQPDLLHNLVTQFSPSILKSEGVSVYRCIQHSGEFVLTFPRAYHCGFNCGFNCAEAVNVAPIDWLPHGQNAVEIYRDQGRKISISQDKLLLGALREAVKAQWNILFLKKTTPDSLSWQDACGQDKTLAQALKARVDMERKRREFLCCSSLSRKMDASFDANGDRECYICHYDLYLSAAACSCSLDKFACLNHAKQMCSCDASKKFFLFRYDINELNILIDALGGKMSAIHRWGVSYLGLSLSSYVAKDKSQDRDSTSESSSNGKHRDKLSSGDSGLSAHLIRKGNQTEAGGAESCISVRTACIKGIGDRQSQITEGCLSSMMGSFANATSQPSGDVRLQSNVHKNSWEEQKPGKQPILVNPPNNLDESMNLLPVGGEDSMQLDDKKCKEPLNFLSDKKVGESINKIPEDSTKTTSPDSKVSSCDCQDQVVDLRETNASAMSKGGAEFLLLTEEVGPLSSLVLNAKDCAKSEMLVKHSSDIRAQPIQSCFPQQDPHNVTSVNGSNLKKELLPTNQGGHCNAFNNKGIFQNSQLQRTINTNDECKYGHTGLRSVNRLIDSGQSLTENMCSTSNNVNQQIGPRMAKVVRRINCIVEPLEFGVVLSGRLWSTSQAIFPKGYRSRVRYFSILNPTQMCYYVSEILDAGLLGPLFMVQVEQCPNEVFIHVSATKCWDMVRERFNHEIRRQHSLGKFNIPTLQPPGSVDGLEMFGLTSPSIIQAIEASDHNHVCSEYWKSRAQRLNPSGPAPTGRDSTFGESGMTNQSSIAKSHEILRGLFKKANPEELNALHHILINEEQRSRQDIVRILNEEIDTRPRTSSR